jgi:flagellar protein FliO/FliZ
MNRHRTVAALIALAIGIGPAAAADDAAGSLVAGALQTFAGLIIVLALIVGAALVVKRIAPGRFGSVNLLKLVASLPVGTRERVVIVEMGDQWLVLGVTPASINTLHTAPKGTLPSPPAGADRVPFAAWLQRARKQHPDA